MTFQWNFWTPSMSLACQSQSSHPKWDVLPSFVHMWWTLCVDTMLRIANKTWLLRCNIVVVRYHNPSVAQTTDSYIQTRTVCTHRMKQDEVKIVWCDTKKGRYGEWKEKEHTHATHCMTTVAVLRRCPDIRVLALSTLCNGTRAIVTVLKDRIVGIKPIHHGQVSEDITWIPHLTLEPSEQGDFHFTLRRRQFALALAFAMTINKSEGQGVMLWGLTLGFHAFHMDNCMWHTCYRCHEGRHQSCIIR